MTTRSKTKLPRITRAELIKLTRSVIACVRSDGTEIPKSRERQFLHVAKTVKRIAGPVYWDSDAKCGCLVGSLQLAPPEEMSSRTWFPARDADQEVGQAFLDHLDRFLMARGEEGFDSWQLTGPLSVEVVG